MTFYIKQNDTVPSIRATLQNGSGNPVDLIDATVRFHMRAIGASAVKVDGVVNIINESLGLVQYNWIGADTDSIGSYQAEFEVTYPDGTIETFPNNAYVRIEIIDDIT